MENEINVAELLRDCPKGMEFDCLLCNNPIALEGVKGDEYGYPIKAVSKDGFHHVFTKYGTSYTRDDAKCVIYPKGKTTWEGFVPPCKFKNGDIVYIVTDECDYRICIFERIVGNNMHTTASVTSSGHFFCPCKEQFDAENFVTYRLATEEEKAKLFKAIKDNCYRWNAENKTLEGLIESRSKVGVPDKFDINTLIPFESRVLTRVNDREKWHPGIWGYYDSDCQDYPYRLIGDISRYCIPYEGNQHLLGTADDCDEFYKTWE